MTQRNLVRGLFSAILRAKRSLHRDETHRLLLRRADILLHSQLLQSQSIITTRLGEVISSATARVLSKQPISPSERVAIVEQVNATLDEAMELCERLSLLPSATEVAPQRPIRRLSAGDMTPSPGQTYAFWAGAERMARLMRDGVLSDRPYWVVLQSPWSPVAVSASLVGWSVFSTSSGVHGRLIFATHQPVDIHRSLSGDLVLTRPAFWPLSPKVIDELVEEATGELVKLGGPVQAIEHLHELASRWPKLAAYTAAGWLSHPGDQERAEHIESKLTGGRPPLTLLRP